MSNAAYNRHDIPRELKRLIDHTDRGIEQLYQLAGRSAAAAAAASPPSFPDEVDEPRSRRDAARERRHGAALRGDVSTHRNADKLRYAKRPSSRSTAQPGRHGSADERRSRDAYYYGGGVTAAGLSRSAGGDSYDEVEDEDDEGSNSEGSSVRGGDAYRRDEAVGFVSAVEEREGHARRRRSLSQDAPRRTASTARPHSSATATATAAALSPHRTLDFSSGTPLMTSPPSLTKPPRYTRHVDLHSPTVLSSPPSHVAAASSHGHQTPSSFLDSSTQQLQPQPQAPRTPPWRQRQRYVDFAAQPSHSPCDLHASPTPSQGSPAGLAAYRAHIAAQHSTQRPSSATDAAARRRRAQRASTLEPHESSASIFMSPGSPVSRSADASQLQPPRSDSSAASGMLSQFGRRWGSIFKDMITDALPAVAPPHPPQPQPQPARVSASTETTTAEAAAQPMRGSTKPAPPSSSASTESSDNKGRHKRRVAVQHQQPQQQHRPSEPRPHSPPAPTPPPSPPAASALVVPQPSADARIAEQLRAELRAREEAMLQLRMEHARAVAELRLTLPHERADAARQTADELAASFAVRQQSLQASLQTERERVAEAEEQLRRARREAAQRKMDLEDASQALESMQRQCAALTAAQTEQATQLTQSRAQAEKAAAAVGRLESEVKVWKAREVDWQAREAQLQQLLQAAEERRGHDEASAQTALAQVETEFTHTAQSYQDLLAEATKRMAHLEKSHRKYKLLKETHAALGAEHDQLVSAYAQRAQQADAEAAALRAEVQELRLRLQQRDATTEQEASAQQALLQDWKRRLELQEASHAEQVRTLQQHVDTANHTIDLLRSQLDGVKQEVREEQAQHQQTQMAAAQAELQAREAQQELQRAAAAYKSRSEDTLAQLRRQLREKDAKMQALAASAADPLHKLRQQLDDERGRRARLEEQFRAFKRKAKEAEEQAASEMRREQLRTALLLTPTAAAAGSALSQAAPHAHPPPRFGRSATATPSPRSASTPHRGPGDAPHGVSGVGAVGGGVGGVGHRPALDAGTVAMAPRPEAVGRTHPAVRVSAAPLANRFATMHVAYSGEEAAAFPASASTSGAADAYVPATPQAGAAPPTVPGKASGARASAATRPERLPAPSPAAAAEGPKPEERTSSAPPSPGTAPSAVSAAAAAADATHAAAAGPDASAISANATVASLSGISRTSPCASTLMLGEAEEDGADENLVVAAVDRAAAGLLRSRPASSKPSSQTAALEAAPAAGEAAPVAFDTAMTTQVYADAGVQAHEHRMTTFHTSAAEVLRRIAGSREEFLAQCAAIVKSTAAAGRRQQQQQQRVTPVPAEGGPQSRGRERRTTAEESSSATSESDDGLDEEDV